MGNVTIRDVARRAKVSVSTVSRVINGNYPVSKESADRVHSAISELDFTPHILASNLKSGKSQMIGLIASNIVNPTIMQMVKGVESVVEKSNYLLTISSTDNDAKKEARLLRYFQDRMVDAAIVITASDDADIFEPLRKAGIPVVLLDRGIANAKLDTVVENNFAASYAMTRLIIEKSHRRIMVLKGRDISIGVDRYQGFLAAMRDYDVPVEAHLQLEGDFVREKARTKVLRFYERHTAPEDRPTVIYAFNHPMTEGVMEALYELGLRIPDDISLVSFGQAWLSRVLRPVITCVFQSSFYMGQQAGKLALQRLEEQREGRAEKSLQIVVESTIIEGDSLLDLAAVVQGQ